MQAFGEIKQGTDCVDTLGHNNVGGSVGLFKCHDAGGNQVKPLNKINKISVYFPTLFVRVVHFFFKSSADVRINCHVKLGLCLSFFAMW